MSLAALPSIDVTGRLSRRPAAGQPRISRADKTLLARSAHGEGRLGPPKCRAVRPLSVESAIPNPQRKIR